MPCPSRYLSLPERNCNGWLAESGSLGCAPAPPRRLPDSPNAVALARWRSKPGACVRPNPAGVRGNRAPRRSPSHRRPPQPGLLPFSGAWHRRTRRSGPSNMSLQRGETSWSGYSTAPRPGSSVAEQRTRNAQVVGSNPTSGSKNLPVQRARRLLPHPSVSSIARDPRAMCSEKGGAELLSGRLVGLARRLRIDLERQAHVTVPEARLGAS